MMICPFLNRIVEQTVWAELIYDPMLAVASMINAKSNSDGPLGAVVTSSIVVVVVVEETLVIVFDQIKGF